MKVKVVFKMFVVFNILPSWIGWGDIFWESQRPQLVFFFFIISVHNFELSMSENLGKLKSQTIYAIAWIERLDNLVVTVFFFKTEMYNQCHAMNIAYKEL